MRPHLKVLLQLAWVDACWHAIWPGYCIDNGVLVHVLEEQRGADGWLVVHARASVTVPASPGG